MASPYNPPTKGEDFIVRIALVDANLSNALRLNPTISTGDFQISKDGGALNNLATLPAVSPAGSAWVTISLSPTEMTADNVQLQAIDQTNPKEWADWAMCIVTT